MSIQYSVSLEINQPQLTAMSIVRGPNKFPYNFILFYAELLVTSYRTVLALRAEGLTSTRIYKKVTRLITNKHLIVRH